MDCLLGATNPFTLNRTLIGHIRLSIIIARDMIQTDNSQRATTHLANPGGVAGYLGEPSQAAAGGRPLAVAAEVGREGGARRLRVGGRGSTATRRTSRCAVWTSRIALGYPLIFTRGREAVHGVVFLEL